MSWAPHQIDAHLDLLRAIDDHLRELRKDLARREERRLKEAGTIPRGASTNGGGACLPNYGRRKGRADRRGSD